MKVFGKPEYLNLYYRYFAPLLAGIDISVWDVLLYLWPSEEMPKGMQGTRPVFSPPKTIRIPIVHLPNVAMETYVKSQESIIAHEYGHYVHTAFMGKDGSEKWQEWAELSGNKLDFDWQTKHLSTPYPHVPAYETFADHFRDWLRGRIVGQRVKKFYLKLWGQKYMAKIEMWIDKKEYTLDGERLESDVAPELKDGRTMVPLRLVAEALGGKVQWVGSEQKIIIEQ